MDDISGKNQALNHSVTAPRQTDGHEVDENFKAFNNITAAQNAKQHEQQLGAKDRIIADLNVGKTKLQTTINDFRVSLDKKNKIIEQKCKEIVEKKYMIDAKNWIIADKDKIVEEQEQKIWALQDKVRRLTDQLEASNKKVKDLEKARDEIDIASEQAQLIMQKEEII